MKPKMKSKMDQKWIKNGSKRPTVNDPNIHTTRMREMRKDIAVIETSNCDLRNNHLKERRESGDSEYTKLVGYKSKASSCRKVASFHDAGWDEYFGMFLVNDTQTG